MNQYGVVLYDFGLQTMLKKLMEDFISPLSKGMCLQRFEKACLVGEPGLSFDSRWPQVNNEWKPLALTVYRETIGAGEKPTSEILSNSRDLFSGFCYLL